MTVVYIIYMQGLSHCLCHWRMTPVLGYSYTLPMLLTGNQIIQVHTRMLWVSIFPRKFDRFSLVVIVADNLIPGINCYFVTNICHLLCSGLYVLRTVLGHYWHTGFHRCFFYRNMHVDTLRYAHIWRYSTVIAKALLNERLKYDKRHFTSVWLLIYAILSRVISLRNNGYLQGFIISKVNAKSR